ncbi:hypothetical protein GCM10007170_36770 [Arthrobacter liuii]|uniref:Uncharacterized protein n=1 Tax=Arthrobacter liuii TaxID=1476996 RepID=A0ABQ2AZY0_9MICC|nr:hypothetical protein GCM10007170_36770 [Arthrobacter liuii]
MVWGRGAWISWLHRLHGHGRPVVGLPLRAALVAAQLHLVNSGGVSLDIDGNDGGVSGGRAYHAAAGGWQPACQQQRTPRDHPTHVHEGILGGRRTRWPTGCGNGMATNMPARNGTIPAPA